MLIPVSSTVYLIAENAPEPIISESTNGDLSVFDFVIDDKIVSTNSIGSPLSYGKSIANVKKLFLNLLYSLAANLIELIILVSLLHIKLIANDGIPACFKNLLPYFS